MNLRLDAASAVISAPSLPDRAAEVFRCPQCFVSCDRTGGDRLPRLGVLAGWDDCVGTAIGDRVVALSSIVGAIRGDAADLLVRGDLTEFGLNDPQISDFMQNYGDFSRVLLQDLE